MEHCLSCRSISGEERISPGPVIYEGQYWLVEHAYPSSLKGWLVIVLKRHAEALHELTVYEYAELGELQRRVIKLLHEETGCLKEYVVCYAEKAGFYHIHFHIIPRDTHLPDKLIGGKIFAMLKVEKDQAVEPKEIRLFCEHLKKRLTRIRS